VKAVTVNHFHVDKSFGRQLREERRASGLSEEQLAWKLQIGPEDISAYESGERRISADYLLRIAKALDVRPASFFRFSDEWQHEAADSDEERSEEPITHPAILDEGLRLNRAFASIKNAEIRQTIVIVVAELTKSGRADYRCFGPSADW
jgi:transcriptional regulator with XRE-family HTH domain